MIILKKIFTSGREKKFYDIYFRYLFSFEIIYLSLVANMIRKEIFIKKELSLCSLSTISLINDARDNTKSV